MLSGRLFVLLLAASALCACSQANEDEKDVVQETVAETTTELPGGQDSRRSGDSGAEVDAVAEVDVNEIPEDVPPAPDVFSTGISAKGYGQHCKGHTECVPYGLACYSWGDEDADPFCSKNCEDSFDCPEYFVCDYKYGFETPLKLCKEAKYCSPCEADIQCSLAGMECIADEKGGKFCSYPCKPGTLSCDGGSRCAWIEAEGGFFCLPYWGACVGDGSQCSPCKVEEDCSEKGRHCIETYYTHERFCTAECALTEDCPHDFGCFDVGGPTGLCFMTFNKNYMPTCHKGEQKFCQECRGDYECAEGFVCYIGPANIGHYCSPQCTADDQCPEGARCTSKFDTGGAANGFACALKPGHECSEFVGAPEGR